MCSRNTVLRNKDGKKITGLETFTFFGADFDIEHEKAAFKYTDLPNVEISINNCQWAKLLSCAEYCKVSMILNDMYKQVRKHRKGRVNKKWAKRYGYRLTERRATAYE